MHPRKKRKYPSKASTKLSRFASAGNGSSRSAPKSDAPPLSGASSAVEATVTVVTEDSNRCVDGPLTNKSESHRSLSLKSDSVLNLSPEEMEYTLSHRQSTEAKAGFSLDKVSVLEWPQVSREVVLSHLPLKLKQVEGPAEPRGQVSASESKGTCTPEVKSYASCLRETSELEEIGTPSEHISGAPFVLIPDENIAAAKVEFQDFIFARFQSDVPSMGRIIGVVNAIWAKAGPRIFVHQVEKGGFLLKVTKMRTRELILSRSVWNIAGFPMFVAPWSPELDPDTKPLTSAVVPVELRNVPYLLFNKESLSRLATAVGKPVSLAPETERKENFQVAKLHVKVDLTRKLPTRIVSGFSSGKEVEIAVSYPWLPVKCESCNRYGHSSDKCRVMHKENLAGQRSEGSNQKSFRPAASKDKLKEVVVDETTAISEDEEMVHSTEVVSIEGSRMSCSKSRRRRSRSRGLPRGRNLSSPPELSGYQLEEGEIGEVTDSEKPKLKEVNQEVSFEQLPPLEEKEDDSVWFTKHSKHYRRALRQLASWKASGAVGLPPKSARFLARGHSSSEELSH